MMKQFATSLCSIILISVFSYAIAMPQVCLAAHSWYVDNKASGTNTGKSWINAWKSFANIVWGEGGVIAGDTLYISGGKDFKTYNEGLKVGTSGTSGAIIYIKSGAMDSSPSGHDGVVTITNASGHGILINNKSYININGVDRNGNRKIRLTRSYTAGLHINVVSATGVAISYLTIDTNGTIDSAWQKNGIMIQTMPGTGSSTGLLDISYCYFDHNLYDQIHILGNGHGCSGYDRVAIHHNEFVNQVDDGVEAGYACGLSFYDNYMHGMSVDPGGHPDGFVTNGVSYLKVYNNKIENMLRQDKHFSSYLLISAQTLSVPAEVNNVLVYNNLLVQENFDNWDIKTPKGSAKSTARGIEVTTGPGSKTTGMKNWVIANNTIIGMPFYGMSLYPHTTVSENIIMVNNIIADCSRAWQGSPGFFSAGSLGTLTHGAWGSGADIIIDYNMFYAGTYGHVNGGTWQKNYISGYSTWKGAAHCNCQTNDASSPIDPKFTATYTLNADSPAVKAGVNLSAYFKTDKAGNVRPIGAAWDIGAYQYKGTTGAAMPGAGGKRLH